jgi:outer membrane protein TolC
VLELSLQDAVDRGLKSNLGLFLSSTAADKSGAARQKALSELLPHVEGSLRESTQRINLHALGIPIATLPRTVDVSNADARVQLAQPLLDLTAISQTRAAGASEEAAHSDYRDARETVAVAVTAAYVAVLSAQARVDFSEADLKTAEALYQLARDRENSGLNPEVDTLRAQVELQARQESVIEATNTLAKQRIVLLRLLGLNIHQPVQLTSSLNKESFKPITNQEAYQQALESRQDYRSAQEQVRSAELEKHAAELERVPKIGIAANYGALGTAPGNAVSTWNVGVALRVPILEGGRIKADISDTDATLRQKRAELEDMRNQIAQQVENALLDLDSANKQVEVSQAALGYANRALTQSKDRFSAGVTNNVEVIQAQEALAGANEQWVNSLYAYSIARVSLARATGTAEATVRSLLGSASRPKPAR